MRSTHVGMRHKALLLGSVIVLGLGLAACAPAQGTPVSTGSDQLASTDAAEEPAGDGLVTMQQWGEQFPLQYNSMKQHYVHEDGTSHGHYDLQAKVLAPVVREGTTMIQDEDGNYAISGFEYDAEIGKWVINEDKLGMVPAQVFKQGCYSCKSSRFDVAYNENGASIFVADMDQEFQDTINGQIWDCAICHGDTPGSAPDNTLVFWSTLARNEMDLFPNAEDRACGQCHNSFDYRSMVTDQETMESFAPYKNGLDIDGLYDAVCDDGCVSEDPDTGHLFWYMDHPDIEIFQQSPMQMAGATCVTCHMPETTDSESGTTYTNHHASSSPLENPDALEVCLTCHKSQGINSADEMVAMVRNLQKETAAVQDRVEEKMGQAREALTVANKGGTVDQAVLEECQDKFGRAEARYRAAVGSGRHGTKIAHNPPVIARYNAEAETMFDEIITALA